MVLSIETQQAICAIAKQYGLQKVILFGSRARGDCKRTSDIDLAVSGGEINIFILELEEIPTLLMFDVVNLDGPVQPELLESIAQEGVCIYEKI